MEPTMKSKMDTMFIARYSKYFAELNSKVLIYPYENGGYPVPTIKLGEGGLTMLPNTNDALQLQPPAMVSLQMENIPATKPVYRIAIPISEIETANNNPDYFNTLMDSVLKQALTNYFNTFGNASVPRYGTNFVNFFLLGKDNEVFIDLGEHYELRLTGSWSADEPSKKG
jgi:hypothetical protein